MLGAYRKYNKEETLRAAFFDLDGCLVDSREPISAAMNVALNELGLPAQEPAHLHPYIGPPLLASFQILRSLQVDPAQAEEAVITYRRVYPDLAVSATRCVPGIPEALAELDGHVTVVVVTSKPVEYAKPIIESVGLDSYFDAVFGPALHAMTEPKAVILEQALALAGVDDRDRQTAAVMIGDREHDVLAGKACGIGTIGVTWGIGDNAELSSAGADAVVDHPWELGPHILTASS